MLFYKLTLSKCFNFSGLISTSINTHLWIFIFYEFPKGQLILKKKTYSVGYVIRTGKWTCGRDLQWFIFHLNWTPIYFDHWKDKRYIENLLLIRMKIINIHFTYDNSYIKLSTYIIYTNSENIILHLINFNILESFHKM